MVVTAVSTQPAPRSVTILGSTGSIGCSTIDLIGRNPGRYTVEALTARRNVELLAQQARSVRPRFVAIEQQDRYSALREALSGTGIEVAAGPEAVVEAACRSADMVMAAIVGAAGLAPTLAAAARGAIVGLANKECLVCAGSLMLREIRRGGATLLPVDSEHNAIFQVFDFERRHAVDHIVLTASGGPFRTFSREAMGGVTPAQAIAHPNWDMGAKISVDSATMMNKGLEVIEAHHLFDMPESRIRVLVHPESVIHSMVAYVDGSILAQLGTPDMRTPIAFTLAWPDRMAAPPQALDLAALARLTFEAPDESRFPALRLAREALRTGGTAPTILNAANEVAVAGFLEGKLRFLDITTIVERTLERIASTQPSSVADVVACDAEARQAAADIMGSVAAMPHTV